MSKGTWNGAKYESKKKARRAGFKTRQWIRAARLKAQIIRALEENPLKQFEIA